MVSAITAREVVARRFPIPPLLNTQRVQIDTSPSVPQIDESVEQPQTPHPALPLPPESANKLVTIARSPASPAGSTPVRPASAPTTTTSSYPGLVQFGSPDFVGPPPPENFFKDITLRWFHGRPIRPSKILWMTVTAYSPDWRSCGDSADNRTATMHCVTTNGHLLIAADPEVLAYGTILSVPGYGLPLNTSSQSSVSEEPIVPVLDCGGAIKGFRLDVLYPTHDEARQWGIRFLPVTVWEYADGQPRPNPRRLR